MRNRVVGPAPLGAVLILKGTGLGGAEQNLPPTGNMTLTIRGDGTQDPAQDAAAAAAARHSCLPLGVRLKYLDNSRLSRYLSPTPNGPGSASGIRAAVHKETLQVRLAIPAQRDLRHN